MLRPNQTGHSLERELLTVVCAGGVFCVCCLVVCLQRSCAKGKSRVCKRLCSVLPALRLKLYYIGCDLGYLNFDCIHLSTWEFFWRVRQRTREWWRVRVCGYAEGRPVVRACARVYHLLQDCKTIALTDSTACVCVVYVGVWVCGCVGWRVRACTLGVCWVLTLSMLPVHAVFRPSTSQVYQPCVDRERCCAWIPYSNVLYWQRHPMLA